jgi:hypothetical protein
VEGPLTPAQAETLARLRGDGPRPTFDPELRVELRRELETRLAPWTDLLPDPAVARGAKPLWAGKTPLARVLTCEAHHLAESAQPFTWSLASVRGTVAHKAIELSLHRTDRPSPLELVDGAFERLESDGTSAGAFLSDLDPSERAELRSEVNNTVIDFLDQFPPLQPRRAWRAATELRLTADICGGRVTLQGKVDLALGAPVGSEAGRAFIELKTGATRSQHVDDLRFYALLETLKVGVPPRRLAVHSLDRGQLTTFDVDEDVLRAAVLRTVDGVSRLIQLHLGLRSPEVVPNPVCRWCCARETCEGAAAWADADLDADLPVG